MLRSNLSQVSQEQNYLGGLPMQFDISSPGPGSSKRPGIEDETLRAKAKTTQRPQTEAATSSSDQAMTQVAEKRTTSEPTIGRSQKPKVNKGDEIVLVPSQETKKQPAAGGQDVTIGQKLSSSSSSAPKPKAKARANSEEPETERQRSRSRAKSLPPPETSHPIKNTPSQMGIQLLKEAFEHAKNNKRLTPTDISSYMKLYDEWKDAKGDAKTKALKLNALQKLYKNTLYKK